MTKLFLDDMREPWDKTWDVVRNYAHFVSYVTKYGVPDVLAFDHDLGFDNTDEEGKTGFDCAKWLVGNNTQQPKLVIVHSWNIDGAAQIGNLFKTCAGVLVVPYPCTILKDLIGRL